ncbi:MAG: cyclodeaminase/cyclohydrolase family protein [Candidatus Limnocylindria bacterium]
MSNAQSLSELSVRQLTDSLASRAPAPGGGSAAALAGAMGAALVGMVVELSLSRAEADYHAELAKIGSAAAALREELLELAERDAAAYDAVISARRLPRGSPNEEARRAAHLTEATRHATHVPLRTAELAADVLDLALRVAPVGNPNAVSDAGVAALLGTAALRGALLNVHINLPFLAADDPLREDAAARAAALETEAQSRSEEALAAVEGRMEVASST